MYRMTFSPLYGRLKLRLNLGRSAVLPGGPFGRSQHRTGAVRWSGSTPTAHGEDGLLEPVLQKPGRRLRLRPILSLEPRKLISEDILDISCAVRPTIRLGKWSGKCTIGYYQYFDTQAGKGRHAPFPQDTRGFLYYHLPQNFPATAGEVRFRLTRHGSPDAFDNSSDLLSRTGLPWSIPLWRIASQSKYSPIQNLLLKEGLVSEALLAKCRELRPPARVWNEQVLYALGQPVPLLLGQGSLTLVVVGRTSTKRLYFDQVAFTPHEESSRANTPETYFHMSIGHDPRRNRFFFQIVAKFEARSRTLVPLNLEPTEICRTSWKDDPYKALCLLLDENSTALRTLEQRPSLPYHRTISTFDPSRLQPLDFVDLSSFNWPTIRVAGCIINLYYAGSGTRLRENRPFPANTRGFLYYLKPKDLPDTAGEIRFRQMPNDEPSNFSQGSDLLLPQGVPWSLRILHLASTPSRTAICESLVQDKIVERTLLDRCRKAFPPALTYNHKYPTIIFALGQPFAVPFGQKVHTIWIADANGAVSLELKLPFLGPFTTKEAIPAGVDQFLSALVCIERQGVKLVVRILDIPVPYRGQTIRSVGDTHVITQPRTHSRKEAVRKLLSAGGTS